MIEHYMTRLAAALRVHGRARRRFLAECRDHLTDLVDEVGASKAVFAFGDPEVVAAAFNAEVATRRSVRSVWWAAVGVAAVGGSTFALIHSADTSSQALVAWSIAFFLSAQVSAVAVVIALIHALRIRHSVEVPADLALLCRRTATALIAASIAMFFAGGALPGQGDARLLLAGPALACVAGTAVARAWWLTRHLDGSRVWTDRSPFADLRSLTRFRLPTLGPAAVAVVAALSAFLRDRGESGSTLHGSILVGAIEAGFVLAAYVLLCAPLGVRRLRTGLGYD